MTPDRPSDEGDYGYDMAHEATDRERAKQHAPDPDPAHPARTAAAPDLEGDYGYDEAHGY